MPVSIPAFPSAGSTSWYSWAEGLDDAVRELQATPPSTYTPPAIAELNSFAGADADAKLTAALSYAAAQTYIPAIRFPTGVTTLNTPGRVPFTGMKLIGPNSTGPKRLDQSSGNSSDHKIVLGTGITTGTSSLFQSTATIYGVFVSGLAFENSGTAQFWHHPSGTLHSSVFTNLAFTGLKHVIGSSGSAALLTSTSFEGNWQVNGYTSTNTQFHIGGTRNNLWGGGFLNCHSTSGNGAYAIDLDGLSFTQVTNVSLLGSGGWMGLRIRNASDGLTLNACTIMGTAVGTPLHGNAVRIEGGVVTLRDLSVGYAMSSPTSYSTTSSGVIHVTGGDVLIDRPVYARATGVAETVPLVYASAGRAEIRNAGASGSWTGLPRAQAASTGELLTDVSLTIV